IDRAASSLRWKSLVAFESLLPIGIGLDQARIDCESFTTDQPLLDAAAQNALEYATEEIALPEAAMPVLGERRVIWHRPIQTEPAEPSVGQIEVNLIAQAPLRSDAEAVTDQEHPDHQLGINRRPTDATVEGRQIPPDLLKVDKPVDRPQLVVSGYMLLERKLIEQRSLFDLPVSHHDLQSCQLDRLNHCYICVATAAFFNKIDPRRTSAALRDVRQQRTSEPRQSTCDMSASRPATLPAPSWRSRKSTRRSS